MQKAKKHLLTQTCFSFSVYICAVHLQESTTSVLCGLRFPEKIKKKRSWRQGKEKGKGPHHPTSTSRYITQNPSLSIKAGVFLFFSRLKHNFRIQQLEIFMRMDPAARLFRACFLAGSDCTCINHYAGNFTITVTN